LDDDHSKDIASIFKQISALKDYFGIEIKENVAVKRKEKL
jgi:hypothetical protein